jgi:hypothetical protein
LQRKPVPGWLIYLLQVIGLLVLGFVALRVGPSKSVFDALVQNATATLHAEVAHSSKR